MSKAILVIDMPDEDLKDYFANVEIFKEDVLRFSADDLACPYRLHQRFKPLPQYKKLEENDIANTNDMWKKIGWNLCIDEILGGE